MSWGVDSGIGCLSQGLETLPLGWGLQGQAPQIPRVVGGSISLVGHGVLEASLFAGNGDPVEEESVLSLRD